MAKSRNLPVPTELPFYALQTPIKEQKWQTKVWSPKNQIFITQKPICLQNLFTFFKNGQQNLVTFIAIFNINIHPWPCRYFVFWVQKTKKDI